jgi:hypothetical protein
VKAQKLALLTLAFLMFFALAASAKIALDPSVVGVGARALGLGRAYVAISGEPDSLFLNPASLGDLSRWGMTSMYSKLISEANYVLLGGVTPTPFGTIGVGLLGASIDGLQYARRDPNTGQISFEAGTTNYYNNIYYLSFGRPILPRLSAGGSFKLFSQGYSNGSDSGSGYDADLGLLYQVSDQLSAGFLQRNFIPASLGGRIKWQSGEEDGIVTSSRLGLSYRPGNVNLSADYELFPTINRPGVLKLGAEWRLSPNFALRAGSDQDVLETNLAAGLTFALAGFQFDYAYHQFGSLAANNTHAFSFSYGLDREPPVVKERLFLQSPNDRSVLFAESVTIEGAADKSIAGLTINGNSVMLEGRGGFQRRQTLALGKNIISLMGLDSRGKVVEEKKLVLLRLPSFPDVGAAHWARIPISALVMERLISGYPDGTFRPEGNITRAELCSVLMKTQPQTSSPKTKNQFKDVNPKHWAAPFIREAVAANLVKGYPNGTFKPNGPVSRAEGVAIFARFAKLKDASALACLNI